MARIGFAVLLALALMGGVTAAREFRRIRAKVNEWGTQKLAVDSGRRGPNTGRADRARTCLAVGVTTVIKLYGSREVNRAISETAQRLNAAIEELRARLPETPPQAPPPGSDQPNPALNRRRFR